MTEQKAKCSFVMYVVVQSRTPEGTSKLTIVRTGQLRTATQRHRLQKHTYKTKANMHASISYIVIRPPCHNQHFRGASVMHACTTTTYDYTKTYASIIERAEMWRCAAVAVCTLVKHLPGNLSTLVRVSLHARHPNVALPKLRVFIHTCVDKLHRYHRERDEQKFLWLV